MTKRQISGALALMVSILLSGCQPDATSNRTGVDPREFDSFYLWPGVHPAPGLNLKTVYLLDGEVRRKGPSRLERLRMGVPRLPGKNLWLVVRTDRLDWNDATYRAIFDDLVRWRAGGNQVTGLQIDFDAATRGIDGYARFLANLRQRLPRRWQLSITGLMDWSAHGDPAALASLAPLIDEVVVQTYQARTTIPGYEDYFRQMKGFPIPFKVALVQDGEWQAPAMLAHHPRFRGYVVFLLARAKQSN